MDIYYIYMLTVFPYNAPLPNEHRCGAVFGCQSKRCQFSPVSKLAPQVGGSLTKSLPYVPTLLCLLCTIWKMSNFCTLLRNSTFCVFPNFISQMGKFISKILVYSSVYLTTISFTYYTYQFHHTTVSQLHKFCQARIIHPVLAMSFPLTLISKLLSLLRTYYLNVARPGSLTAYFLPCSLSPVTYIISSYRRYHASTEQ